MISSAIFVRIVPADRDRGFICLVGHDAQVVQRTAVQQLTISVPTRSAIDAVLERVRANYNASELRNVTAAGVQKRLEKLFNETAIAA